MILIHFLPFKTVNHRIYIQIPPCRVKVSTENDLFHSQKLKCLFVLLLHREDGDDLYSWEWTRCSIFVRKTEVMIYFDNEPSLYLLSMNFTYTENESYLHWEWIISHWEWTLLTLECSAENEPLLKLRICPKYKLSLE